LRFFDLPSFETFRGYFFGDSVAPDDPNLLE
jgi:hypothetical protein